MKFLSTIAGICFWFISVAQSESIHFIDQMTWQEVQMEAKKENKFIFIDCYTTWCAPCKYMSQYVFTQKEVGDFVNANFICVKLQCDTSDMDSGRIKKWYSDAHNIATEYGVSAYPTFLFFNPNGQLKHRAVGSADAASFIQIASDALNPDKQFYQLISRYRSGDKDTILLEILGRQALINGNELLADSVLKKWFSEIRNPYTKDRLEILANITKHPNDLWFNLFYKNADRVDLVMNKDFAELVVMNVIITNNVKIKTIFTDSLSVPDWNQISDDISHEYDRDYARRTVTCIKVPYFKMKQNWPLYDSCAIIFLKTYGGSLPATQVNNYAWDIFEHSSKKDEMEYAANRMKSALESGKKKDPGFIDTYANLLYKCGKVELAIKEETEAVEIAGPEQQSTLLETLDKMKSHVRTWN